MNHESVLVDGFARINLGILRYICKYLQYYDELIVSDKLGQVLGLKNQGKNQMKC